MSIAAAFAKGRSWSFSRSFCYRCFRMLDLILAIEKTQAGGSGGGGIEKPETVQYNKETGSFVNPSTQKTKQIKTHYYNGDKKTP